METQRQPLGDNPSTTILQQNFKQLFELAHQHPVKSTLPGSGDGSSRDIAIVDDGTNVYLAIKTSRGWFRTSALTAI